MLIYCVTYLKESNIHLAFPSPVIPDLDNLWVRYVVTSNCPIVFTLYFQEPKCQNVCISIFWKSEIHECLIRFYPGIEWSRSCRLHSWMFSPQDYHCLAHILLMNHRRLICFNSSCVYGSVFNRVICNLKYILQLVKYFLLRNRNNTVWMHFSQNNKLTFTR